MSDDQPIAPSTTPAAEVHTIPDGDAGEAGPGGVAAAYAAALDRLRAAYLAAEPALQPAMLAGDTLEELEANHAAALAALAAVRAAVAREAAMAPAGGAPGRVAVSPATAIEKIRDGLARLPGAAGT